MGDFTGFPIPSRCPVLRYVRTPAASQMLFKHAGQFHLDQLIPGGLHVLADLQTNEAAIQLMQEEPVFDTSPETILSVPSHKRYCWASRRRGAQKMVCARGGIV